MSRGRILIIIRIGFANLFKGSLNNQFIDLGQHVLSKSLTKMNIHGWIEWVLISKLRKPNEILKIWILFDLKDRFLVTKLQLLLND